MLTDQEQDLIARYNRWEFTDPNRYPHEVLHAFRGLQAFDLHAKLLYPPASREEHPWMQQFSDEDRLQSGLLIIQQTTVSKATLKNPHLPPTYPKRRLLAVFYNNNLHQPVRTAYGYSKPQAKRWLKLIREAAAYDLLAQ
jgi:hypothetical protein